MATQNGGVIRGIEYKVGQQFTAAATLTGKAQADGGGSDAKQRKAGDKLYYRKHDKDATYQVAICGTNNTWVDGWYKVDIVPRATYKINLSHGGDSTNDTSTTKTWGVSLTLPTPDRADTTPDGYTVTYNYGGNGKGNESVTVKNTTSYTFQGWTIDGTSGIRTYSPTENNFGGTAASEKTATAGWSSNTTKGSVTLPTPSWANTTTSGKVTYNASTNGGTTDKASDDVNLTVTHTFQGWYNGSSYVAMGNTKYTPTANVTLTAKWDTKSSGSATVKLPTASKANGTASRTVTINANSGSTTVSSLKSNATVKYESTGWWTSASGGNKVGKNGDSITPSTAPITYYAQFSGTTGSYSAVTLPTAAQCTRSGYSLKGFATNNSATTASYLPGASYTPSGNVTLYAVWEEVAGKVYTKKNGAWVEAKAIYTKVNGSWI
jgi:hypothetical protein